MKTKLGSTVSFATLTQCLPSYLASFPSVFDPASFAEMERCVGLCFQMERNQMQDLPYPSISICAEVCKTKLRGFSPQASYNDRATAACRRS
jgi:hypothetical protein